LVFLVFSALHSIKIYLLPIRRDMYSLRDTVSTLGVEMYRLLQRFVCLCLVDWHSIVSHRCFCQQHNSFLILCPVIPHPDVNRTIMAWLQQLLKACLAFQIEVVWTSWVK